MGFLMAPSPSVRIATVSFSLCRDTWMKKICRGFLGLKITKSMKKSGAGVRTSASELSRCLPVVKNFFIQAAPRGEEATP